MFSTDNTHLYVKDEPLRHPLCSTIYERLLTLNDKSKRYTSNKVHEKVQVTRYVCISQSLSGYTNQFKIP